MKLSDIEKLKNIADAGGARHLADVLIGPFRELASLQGCESRLLKHGVLFQRGPGNAVLSLYFSRTSSRGTAEVAFADENIARLYKRPRTAVAEWLNYLMTEIGKPVKSPTSQGYPRVSVASIEEGLRLKHAIQAFFLGTPYRTLAESKQELELTPAEADAFQPTSVESGSFWPDDLPGGLAYFEGLAQQVIVNRYERSPDARAACILHYGSVCQVCHVDFGKRYGALGMGFIHVHHILPISSVRSEYRIDPVADLVPVCPNCHAMLHRREPPLTIEDLRAFFHED